jgi:hypothetical protein
LELLGKASEVNKVLPEMTQLSYLTPPYDITDEILQHMTNLTGLSLSSQHAFLSDVGISKLRGLQVLDIPDTKFSDRSLIFLVNLTDLNLDGNRWATGLSIVRMTNLCKLSIRGKSSIGRTNFAYLPYLEDVVLDEHRRQHFFEEKKCVIS